MNIKNSNELDFFYKKSVVLITGGNGFLGKFLVETLLRCFDVDKIYLLIRSKKNESPEKRLKTMLSDQLFDQIRENEPKTLEKLHAIPTDFDANGIMSEENLEKILNEVNVVFHALATIKFNESLHDAVAVNMLNTQKIVKICNRIKNLKSFVHVSTLFSNCNQKFADETIYNHSIDYQQLITIAELSRRTENEESAKLIFQHDFPNTYSLTKHFAEKLVVDQAGKIPTGIFRPPIVTSSYKNFPGWTDNINGFSGVVVSLVKGYSHCWLGYEENASNIAPVDYCINAIVAAAWDVSEKFKKSQEKREKFSIPIYNFMFDENNITYGNMMKLLTEGFSSPFEGTVYYYSNISTSWKFLFLILHFIFATLPAFVLDTVVSIQGGKRKYLRISKKIEEFFLVLSHFTLTRFEFGNENLRTLLSKVQGMNGFREELNFDFKNIEWNVFFKNHQKGLKKYFFKENLDEERMKILRKNLQRKKFLHQFLKMSSFLILSFIIVRAILLKCY